MQTNNLKYEIIIIGKREEFREDVLATIDRKWICSLSFSIG